MALLDLKTDLKSLKYGNDLPGGGSSGQPYQQVDINTVDSGFNRFRMTKFDDGLVRGGVVGAANAAVVDTFRIGKFLKDFPKGPLFIVKQIGLQLSNPRLESKKLRTDNPTTGGGLLRNVGNLVLNTANKIVNAVGPTRIYNLGINTLAQVPVNAFGQHIVRHGFTPRRNDDNLYFKVANYNNNEENNRLIQLKSIIGNENDIASYIGGPSSIYGIGKTTIRRRGNFININQDVTANPWASFLTFSSSPNSFANSNAKAGQSLINGERQAFAYIDPNTFNGAVASGMGTRNKFSEWNRTKYIGGREYALRKDIDYIEVDPNIAAQAIGQVSSKNDVLNIKYIANNKETAASEKMRTPSAFVGASLRTSSSFASESFPSLSTGSNKPSGLSELDKLKVYTGSTTWTPQNGESNEAFGQPGSPRKVNKYADLGLTILTTGNRGDLDISDFTTNGENTIAYTPSAITTGNVAKYAELRKKVDAINNIQQNYFKTIPADKIDKKAKKYEVLNRTNDVVVNNDSLALQFTPLDPFTGNALNTLKFLGYINDYTENYDSTWNPVKYTGRAESFYIFNEFKRTVNVGFSIPCYNYNELLIKHCALSELASVLAGKYKGPDSGTNNGALLGGIITKLKVGNYINNQPGIITNLTFSPIQDSSWDLDAELAFYLRVNFGFTLIHNYLPQYEKCGFIFKTPDPIPTPPPTPPTESVSPPTPPVTSSVVPTNNTGSYLKPLGRVDLRNRPVSTLVKKPYILDDLKKVTKAYGGDGGGSFGGGGGGDTGGGFNPRPTWE